MPSASAIVLHEAPATRAQATASRSRRSNSPRRSVIARSASSGSSVPMARRRRSPTWRSPVPTSGVYPPTLTSTPVAATHSGAMARETSRHAQGDPPAHPPARRRGGPGCRRQRGHRGQPRDRVDGGGAEQLDRAGRRGACRQRGRRPAGRPAGRLSTGGAMTKEPDQFKPLTREELTELAGEELPERAAMSLVNANVAIPINAAVAANVLSDGAAAVAVAQQQTPIDQSNL